jgi:hypothetical protein
VSRIYTRAPAERVGRAFALLTKTYHGSRRIGHVVPERFHFSGNRVYQALCNIIQSEARMGILDSILGLNDERPANYFSPISVPK